MSLVALLLTMTAVAPARADSPFSIVFGLDQQHRPAFSIKAFGPSKGQKMFSIDSIDTSGRPSLYTEFKPPASPASAPAPVGAMTAKQSRAAAIFNGTLHLLRALIPHH